MGCDDEKLSKYLTHTFMAHCHTMICQQVTLSGAAEWPKVADAVIEALIAMIAGWLQRHQQHVIAYLQEENRVLKAHLSGHRLRLTNTERRRLAALAYPLGRKRLQEVATLVERFVSSQ